MINLSLHPAQLQVYNAAKSGAYRLIHMRAGRRFGKTEFCARYITEYALTHPNSRIGWVCPYYSTTGIGRDTFLAFVDAMGLGRHKAVSRTGPPAYYIFKNGSHIDFLTAENIDSLIGRKFDLLIVDEAARCKAEAWLRALKPTLMDNPYSLAIFISTPNRKNWFYELHLAADSPERKHWTTFHFTTRDNPHLPAEDVEAEINDESVPWEWRQQELLADFVGGETEGIPGWAEIMTSKLTPPDPAARYVHGVDIGHAKDFTVISTFDAESKAQVHFERFQDRRLSTQRDRVLYVTTKYPGRIIIETNNAGEPFIQDLEDQHNLDIERFTTTRITKPQLVTNYQQFVGDGSISLIPDEQQKKEHEVFEVWWDDESRTMKAGAPHGQHDDFVIADALACWGLRFAAASAGLPTGARTTGVVRESMKAASGF